MKTSEALKECLSYLWDGKEQPTAEKSVYICFALSRVVTDNDDGAIHRAKTHIERSMGLRSWHSLENWLYNKKLIPSSRFSKINRPLRIKIQAYRKAWVEHLIKEFVAKGD